MSDRYYLISPNPDALKTFRESESLFLLEDKSTVICSVKDESMARALADGDEELVVRSHSELNPTEQQRLQQAV